MTMVAAVELDYPGPAGGCACDSYRGHPGFGSGTHQAHLFRDRNFGAYRFCKLDLEFGRRTVAQSSACLLRNCSGNFQIRMAEDRWSVGADVIDKAVAIRVEQVRAFAALDKERRAADRLPRTHR